MAHSKSAGIRGLCTWPLVLVCDTKGSFFTKHVNGNSHEQKQKFPFTLLNKYSHIVILCQLSDAAWFLQLYLNPISHFRIICRWFFKGISLKDNSILFQAGVFPINVVIVEMVVVVWWFSCLEKGKLARVPCRFPKKTDSYMNHFKHLLSVWLKINTEISHLKQTFF